MTNYEYLIKHEEEIVKEALVGTGITKVNGEIRVCRNTSCLKCDFAKNKDCRSAIREWLDEEHVEKPKSCPFCGSENTYISKTAHYIQCNYCGAATRCYNTEEEAKQALADM